jgi:hypothetical protein
MEKYERKKNFFFYYYFIFFCKKVFQVKKVSGSHQGQIFAMKVLKKAT